MNEATLMNRLTTEIPELKPLLHEHLVDQEGEMLPYLLMADISRWAHENAAPMPDRVSQLTRRLEHEFAVGDEAIKNLIGVGFVEMLPETPRGDAVLSLLGPMLRGVAHDMNLFEPWPEGDSSP
jgi:hypothetical protein